MVRLIEFFYSSSGENMSLNKKCLKCITNLYQHILIYDIINTVIETNLSVCPDVLLYGKSSYGLYLDKNL